MTLEHPLTRQLNATRSAMVQATFGPKGLCGSAADLALYRYLESIPERFFDRAVEIEVWAWMAVGGRVSALEQLIRDEPELLSNAFGVLSDVCALKWHDENDVRNSDELRFLDRDVHPTYLRLVEAVMHGFLRPFAAISRQERKVGTDKLDIFNVVDELAARGLARTTRNYDHVMRNGIGHGHVRYHGDDVIYENRGNSVQLRRAQVRARVDATIDDCNGIAVCLKTFLLARAARGAPLPRELATLALRELVAAPWWTVETALASDTAVGSRLDVFVRVSTRNFNKVLFSSIQTAAFAENLCPGYARYFLSIQSEHAWPGWADFNGQILKQLREGGATDVHEYASALQGPVFFVPNRSMAWLTSKADVLLSAFQLRRQHLDAVAAVEAPHFIVRKTRAHRDPRLVVDAYVVIRGGSRRWLRENLVSISAAAVTETRRSSLLARTTPLGYVKIHLYSSDFRVHRLCSYGLGEDLIAVATLSRDPRKAVIDIRGSRVELVGQFRVAWNRLSVFDPDRAEFG